MDVIGALERFFERTAPLGGGDEIVVAFSGGPDSTALLWGLCRLAERRGFRVSAAHLDHALDPGSAGRARAAARLAAELAVLLISERWPVGPLSCPGEGVEAAARRVRYAFLGEVCRDRRARYLATAHHRDDQAETVLLRLLFGSGIAGLAGIHPQVSPRPFGRLPARPPTGGAPATAIVRPLLALPRSALAAAVEAAGLTPVADPTNDDLGRPRNLLRHRLLPALARETPDLPARAAALAEAARGALGAIEARLAAHLQPAVTAGGVAVDVDALRRLPAPLLDFALALLHRAGGAPYPAARAARAELARQLRAGVSVACDCGGSWRWSAEGDRFTLRRHRPLAEPFTYTLTALGEIDLPELAVRFRLSQGPVRPWMFHGSPRRAGLALPLAPGGTVTVRSRRPGDRIRPLGAPGSRRLKEVLIDHRLPRCDRDRLPLLCLGPDGGTVAWVLGVTVDERFRLTRGDAVVWVAEAGAR